MKKKTVIGLLIVGVLGAALYIRTTIPHESGLDSDPSVRTAQDIASDDVIYMDDDALAAADSSSESSSLRSDALRAYNLVNEERDNAGLSDLTWSSNLETTAAVRAEEASVTFSHTRPNGSQWYTVNSKIMGGENLAWGQTNAKQVVNEWMNSPAHRDNILYDDFNNVAISLYQNDEGTNYWALEFGY